jgi:hypothetical protein
MKRWKMSRKLVGQMPNRKLEATGNLTNVVIDIEVLEFGPTSSQNPILSLGKYTLVKWSLEASKSLKKG